MAAIETRDFPVEQVSKLLHRAGLLKPVAAVLVLCLLPTLASAATWRGALVDARCFQSEERNVNPDYRHIPAARDLGFEIRACFPRANTKAFAIVLPTGQNLALDPAGNAQAARLVVKAGKPGKRQHYFVVKITGISRDTLYVDSIAEEPQGVVVSQRD